MPDYAARRTMMVDTQVRPSDVTKFPVIEAMLSVPREVYVPRALREAAYLGENLPLGEGRVLLEPRTLGKMLDALAIGRSDMVLDLGCGLGYSAAVIARLAEMVVAVEEAPMAAEAETLLAEQGVTNAAVIEGSLAEGAPGQGPFDAIMLEGGAEEVPEDILAQLKEGGRIACLFMEGALGTVRIGRKTNGTVAWSFAFNASAPVLQGFEKQRSFAL